MILDVKNINQSIGKMWKHIYGAKIADLGECILRCSSITVYNEHFLAQIFEGKIMRIIHGYNDYLAWV